MIIYMAEAVFNERRKEALQKKFAVIRPYFEKVYRIILREDLCETHPEKVDELFKAMHKLSDEERFFRSKGP